MELASGTLSGPEPGHDHCVTEATEKGRPGHVILSNSDNDHTATSTPLAQGEGDMGEEVLTSHMQASGEETMQLNRGTNTNNHPYQGQVASGLTLVPI